MRAGGRGRLLAESSPKGLSDVINAAAVAQRGTARAGPAPGQCEEAPALLGGQRKAKRWDPAVLEAPRPPMVLRRLHVSVGAHCGGRGLPRGQVSTSAHCHRRPEQLRTAVTIMNASAPSLSVGW